MKRLVKVLLPLLAGFSCVGLTAGADESIPRLAGIVMLPNLKMVLLEAAPRNNEARNLLLGAGQRDAEVEVVEINAAQRSVKVNLYAKTGMVPVTLTNLALKSGLAVCLDSATLDPILTLYAKLANRTLLRSSLLPHVTLTLNAVATKDAEAAQALQSALAAKGISILPDGNRFLMVVPKAEVLKVKPMASQIKPSAVAGSGGETFPLGMIQFFNADPMQVLEVYASLVGRKVQRAESWPSDVAPGIKFSTQTPVSKEEAIYALGTVLEWAGLKLVRVGEDGLKAVPAPENRR